MSTCSAAAKPRGGDCARTDFNRDVDESIGSALPIRREVPLIVTEGNYLLTDVVGGLAWHHYWTRAGTCRSMRQPACSG